MDNINAMIDDELAKNVRREPIGVREIREASEAARESGAIGKVRFDEALRKLNAEKVAAGYADDVRPTETPAPQFGRWEYLGVGGSRSPLGGERNQAQTVGRDCEYRPSVAEATEKEASYHAERAMKLNRAAAFFQKHPAFAEFIDLIRQGVISI